MAKTAKIYYSYAEFIIDIKTLVSRVEQLKPKFIIGINRGGLTPAVYLSHFSNVPMKVVDLQKDALDCVMGISIPDMVMETISRQEKVLFIDDICDTGATFVCIQEEIIKRLGDRVKSSMFWASLWHNTGQKFFAPDFSVKKINKSKEPSWIVFPWEII